MSTGTGNLAEEAAADFLKRKGCNIVARNWRTRMCEIDIIAERNKVIYFCEVKYRRTSAQGTGLDYITPKKLDQMRFAAESWVHTHAWAGEYELVAIEASGPTFQITAAITVE